MLVSYNADVTWHDTQTSGKTRQTSLFLYLRVYICGYVFVSLHDCYAHPCRPFFIFSPSNCLHGNPDRWQKTLKLNSFCINSPSCSLSHSRTAHGPEYHADYPSLWRSLVQKWNDWTQSVCVFSRLSVRRVLHVIPSTLSHCVLSLCRLRMAPLSLTHLSLQACSGCGCCLWLRKQSGDWNQPTLLWPRWVRWCHPVFNSIHWGPIIYCVHYFHTFLKPFEGLISENPATALYCLALSDQKTPKHASSFYRQDLIKNLLNMKYCPSKV